MKPTDATTDPSSAAFFEAKYASSEDPWAFETSPYELRRYEAVLAALGERRFGRAFEPGCSIGVFTAMLAPLCDSLLACDISPTAARRAAERCVGLTQVEVRCEALGSNLPPGPFDLLVLNEIGYYFSLESLGVLAVQLVHTLRPDGTLLASHWLGNSPDHRISGDDVHHLLQQVPGLVHELSARHEGFRIDRWRKAPPLPSMTAVTR